MPPQRVSRHGEARSGRPAERARLDQRGLGLLPLAFVSACLLAFTTAMGRFGFGFRLGVIGLGVAAGMGVIAAVQMGRRRPRPATIPRATVAGRRS